MVSKPPKPEKAKRTQGTKGAKIYDHTEEKLLLWPDVGLQSQFKQRKQPKTDRYDPSLDLALSWDGSAEPDQHRRPLPHVAPD